jgi:hypothetical protein
VRWVEIEGRIIETLPVAEPALPATLSPGQVLELPFSIPAPRSGPPSAHAGVGAVAWAVEAHWEVPTGRDARVAAVVDLRPPTDIHGSGAPPPPAGALDAAATAEGAVISVTPAPPLPSGSIVTVGIAWPDAPGGRSARVELTADVGGASALSVVAASVETDHDGLANAVVQLPIPADAPPTLSTDGLTVGYRIRVIVDRKLRSDESRELPVVVG